MHHQCVCAHTCDRLRLYGSFSAQRIWFWINDEVMGHEGSCVWIGRCTTGFGDFGFSHQPSPLTKHPSVQLTNRQWAHWIRASSQCIANPYLSMLTDLTGAEARQRLRLL